MTLPPEEMVWLTRYVICALPVMALLNLLIRKDALSLCFGFVFLLLSPILLSAVTSVQNGAADSLFIGIMAILALIFLPTVILPALFHMKSAREDT